MGTRLDIRVRARSRDAGILAIEHAFLAVHDMEDRLSSWRPDSELGRLNCMPPGQPFLASARLFDLLRQVRRWQARTGGAFDPGIGSLVDAWDLRGVGRRPSPDELHSALRQSGLTAFRFDDEARTVVRRYPGSWLTAGGFGKGAALRAARRALAADGVSSALLDFGGQLLAMGRPPGATGWIVGVADPTVRDRPVAFLLLSDRSASTSGDSERFVEVAGERLGHILDPRTGRPTRAWGSVTVVARDPMVADMLSTALFVMGPDRALIWGERHPGYGVLVLESKGTEITARWNRGLAPYLVGQPAVAGGGRQAGSGKTRRRENR